MAQGANMNYTFLTATGLSALTAIAHVFGGGPEFHQPILESGLSQHVKAGFSVVWHATTIMLVVNSLLLFLAATNRSGGRDFAWVVILQYLPFAAIFLYFGMTRLGNITDMPQWTAFLLIAGLALFGLKCSQKTEEAEPC